MWHIQIVGCINSAIVAHCQMLYQGSHTSWNSWKVLEILLLPGISLNLQNVPGNSWKISLWLAMFLSTEFVHYTADKCLYTWCINQPLHAKDVVYGLGDLSTMITLLVSIWTALPSKLSSSHFVPLTGHLHLMLNDKPHAAIPKVSPVIVSMRTCMNGTEQ